MQETLRRLDRRLTEAHDSRGAAAYVVFGLVALFALLALGLRSSFWGRAALLAGPVALTAALALSGLDVARPRSVGLALLVVVGLGDSGSRRGHTLAPGPRGVAAGDLRGLRGRARVLDRDELAGRARPAPRRRGPVLRDLEPGRDAAPRSGPARRGAPRRRPAPARRRLRPRRRSGRAGSVRTAAECSCSPRATCSCGCGSAGSRSRGGTSSSRARRRSERGCSSSAWTRPSAARATSRARSATVPGALAGELAHRWRVSLDGYVATWQATAIITFSLLVLVWIALRRPRFATVDAVLVALAVSLLVNDSPRDVVAYGALSCAALRFWEETRPVQ